jgi:hypothetical protein
MWVELRRRGLNERLMKRMMMKRKTCRLEGARRRGLRVGKELGGRRAWKWEEKRKEYRTLGLPHQNHRQSQSK